MYVRESSIGAYFLLGLHIRERGQGWSTLLVASIKIDEFHIIDAILNWGARFENRGSDISLKLQRNIASNDLIFFVGSGRLLALIVS